MALVHMIQHGRAILLVSDVLVDELADAPVEVQAILADIPETAVERLARTPETARLRNAYLSARVVGRAHARDAEHIAHATVARADLMVSWNFRHIVHWDKIRLFNAVNLREGYLPIEIRSPREVVP